MIVAVTVGTIIQSSIGFGLALVVVPTLTLIRPDALPATILLIALPMTTFMALRERRSIDVAGLRRAAAARLPGTLAGVMLLAYVPDDSLSVVIGSLIIVAAGISALRPQLEVGRGTSLVAGFASGLMGTAAGIGGPPMALAYQRRPGGELRATLAGIFVLGSLMSLAGLGLSGRVHGRHILLALELLPGIGAGLLLSRHTARLLDGGWVRAAVVAFAAVTGAVGVLEGLTG